MNWKTNIGSNYVDAGLFIDDMYIFILHVSGDLIKTVCCICTQIKTSTPVYNHPAKQMKKLNILVIKKRNKHGTHESTVLYSTVHPGNISLPD